MRWLATSIVPAIEIDDVETITSGRVPVAVSFAAPSIVTDVPAMTHASMLLPVRSGAHLVEVAVSTVVFVWTRASPLGVATHTWTTPLPTHVVPDGTSGGASIAPSMTS